MSSQNMETLIRKLPQFLKQLYQVVDELEGLAPQGRRFTLDGHLVGSIGELVASYAYGIELRPSSHKGIDGVSEDGRLVQIKLTQGSKSVQLSYNCEHLIVLQLLNRQKFIEIYNGSGSDVWNLIANKKPEGQQRPISIPRLKNMQASAKREGVIQQKRPFPAI